MKAINRIILRKKLQQEKNSEQLQQDESTGDITLDNHGREGDNDRLADNQTLLHYAQGKDLAQRSCNTCSVLHPFDPVKLKPGHRYIGVYAIRKTAAEGCELCSILLKVATYKVDCVSFLTFSFQYGYLAVVASWDDGKSTQREYCVNLHTLPGQPSPWPCFTPQQHIPPRVEIWNAIRHIKKWLSQCVSLDSLSFTGHQCHEVSELIMPVLPTRVLDVSRVGPDGKVYLVRSNGKRQKYTTLSHCWGDANHAPITTSKATVSDRASGIFLDSLPKTFRDAVVITYHLNINYIWIDSLCIIQDSEEDWNLEASRMAQIYSSSFLNIAATACKDSTVGLFYDGWNEEDGFLGTPREIRGPGSPTNHGDYSIYMQEIDHSHIHDSELRIEGPLMSRAWAYQERFLAPRTVHFTSAEMIWECGSMVVCVCPCDIHLGLDTVPRYHNYSHREKKDQWFGQWGIIDEYSKLNLSKPADRLPAIAGIASHFESHKRRIKNGKSTTSRYFAGLWEDNLHHNLLWRVIFPENKPREVVRIVPYNAPTWSWASLDSKFMPSGKPGHGVNIGNHYSTGGIASDFKILDCFTTLIDPSNIYGGVRGGKIVLQGRSVTPTKVKLLYEEFQCYKLFFHDVEAEGRAIKDNQNFGKLMADIPLRLSKFIKDRVDCGELHCLWINSFHDVRRNDYRHLALVLKQSETSEVYERVGIATFDKGGKAGGCAIGDSTFGKFMESIWTRSSIQIFEVV
ncbi:hypothetical protein BGAL_0443g00030 [Botrytis galanthina]|uniref:Heterokaryon incompatibility domain-containing protein n=1 Tax=Botrytis galanthina TaxID=278940 RepID=A0A4V4HTK0_9HELO|nr:hypothetical protein BGAL_0443g00030 [Botrytis galanthina]